MKFWGLFVVPSGDLYLGNQLSACVKAYNDKMTSVDPSLFLHTSNLLRWAKKDPERRRRMCKGCTQVFKNMSWATVSVLCDKKRVTTIICVPDWRGRLPPSCPAGWRGQSATEHSQTSVDVCASTGGGAPNDDRDAVKGAASTPQ